MARIGLGEWLFDFDQESNVARYEPTVMEMAQRPAAARAKLVKTQRFVEQRQRESMQVLHKELNRL